GREEESGFERDSRAPWAPPFPEISRCRLMRVSARQIISGAGAAAAGRKRAETILAGHRPDPPAPEFREADRAARARKSPASDPGRGASCRAGDRARRTAGPSDAA